MVVLEVEIEPEGVAIHRDRSIKFADGENYGYKAADAWIHLTTLPQSQTFQPEAAPLDNSARNDDPGAPSTALLRPDGGAAISRS